MTRKGFEIRRTGPETWTIFTGGERLTDCGSLDIARRVIDERIARGMWTVRGSDAGARDAAPENAVALDQMTIDDLLDS